MFIPYSVSSFLNMMLMCWVGRNGIICAKYWLYEENMESVFMKWGGSSSEWSHLRGSEEVLCDCFMTSYYSFLLEWNSDLQFHVVSKSQLMFHFESAKSCAHARGRVRSFSCSTWENYSYQSGIKEGSKTCFLSSYWEICAFWSIGIF